MTPTASATTPTATPTPSTRLKNETAHLHELAEHSPLQRDLAKGRLPRDLYARHLGQLLHVHTALESCLWPLREVVEPIRRVVRDEHARVEALRADLAHFDLSPGDCPPLPATQALVDDIRRLATDRPLALLGMHYVLEGSANGAKFIAMNVRPAYALTPGTGDRYLDPYGERQREVWGAFKRDLDACDFTDGQVDDLLAGAARMFDGVREVGEALLALA